jgi:hypothetical protein
MFLHGIFILTVWLDKTSNISILSCKLQTPALLPTHVTVGLPHMEGAAYSAICDATFMSRRAIRVAKMRGITGECMGVNEKRGHEETSIFKIMFFKSEDG